MGHPDIPRGPTPNQPRVTSMKHEVFVIYRPVTSCPICTPRFQTSPTPDADDPEGAPDLEDPPEECPHNRKEEYNTLLQQAVDGRISFTQQNETTLASGQVQVSVVYVTFDGPSAVNRPAPPRDL